MSVALEIKGLDLVKRDYAPIGSDLCFRVIERIMMRKKTAEVLLETLEDCISTIIGMRDATIPIEKFVITKALSKLPQEYGNVKGLYHVQVALQTPKTSPYKRGDFVQFIMVDTLHPVDVSEASKDPIEYLRRIDCGWYSTQIYGMLDRILTVVEGYNYKDFLECLDVKLGNNRRHIKSTHLTLQGGEYLVEREPLSITCKACQHVTTCSGLFSLEKLFEKSEEKHLNGHWTEEELALVFPTTFAFCSPCGTLFNWDDALANATERQLYSVLANFEYRRLLFQLDCNLCQRYVVIFLSHRMVIPSFDRITTRARQLIQSIS
jgi:hypothetical protein